MSPVSKLPANVILDSPSCLDWLYSDVGEVSLTLSGLRPLLEMLLGGKWSIGA